MSKPSNSWVKPLAAVWLVAAVVGSGWLTVYSQKPGEAARPAVEWPDGVTLPRPKGLNTLVMTLHPKCPCSEASVAELEKVVTRAPAGTTYYVILVKPTGATGDWSDTPTANAARAIPGVTVVNDDAGRQAALLDAKTSGQVVVFDAAGRLTFSGGITESRGHQGDNAARDAVEQILIGRLRPDEAVRAPVYGCGLVRQEARS